MKDKLFSERYNLKVGDIIETNADDNNIWTETQKLKIYNINEGFIYSRTAADAKTFKSNSEWIINQQLNHPELIVKQELFTAKELNRRNL